MEDNLEQHVDFVLNPAEVRTATDQIRNNILGVGEDAAVAVERIEQSFEALTETQRAGINQVAKSWESLEKELKDYRDLAKKTTDVGQLEQYNQKIKGIGVELSKLKKVGLDGLHEPIDKAAGSFNGLSNSINQISRELPAFTFSAQTGFLAISNNLPIFFDEVQRTSAALDEASKNSAVVAGEQAAATAVAGGASEEAASQIGELAKEQALSAAEGKKGIGILKAIGSSFFSVNTLMSIGVTLLTIYGKEIGDWVTSLFGANAAAKEFEQSLQDINKAYIGNFAKEKSSLDSLLITAKNELLSKESRMEAIKKLNQLSPTYLNGLTLEKLKTDEGTAALDKYILSLKRKAIEEVTASKRTELYTKRLELSEQYQEAKSNVEEFRTGKRKGTYSYANQGTTGGTTTTVDYRKTAELEFKKVADADKLLVDQLNKLDAFTQQQILANSDMSADTTVAKRNKDFYDNIIRVNQAALNDLDKSAVDFKARSAVYKAAIIDAKENLRAYDASADGKADSKAANALNKVLNTRKGLLQKITDLDNEYARKSYTQDDEELKALSDKFKKANDIITAYNAKNPKNAIDTAGLKAIQDRAKEDIVSQRAFEASKITIDQQKQLFDQFESYKLDVGVRKAKERFSGELKGYENYVSYLNSLMPKAADQSAGANSMRDYLKTAIVEAEKEQSNATFDAVTKNLKRILDATQNAAVQRLEIESQYDKDVAALNADKTMSDGERSARIAKLNETKDLELKANKAIANQESQFYKDAMKDVTNASLAELKQRIRDAEKELENSKLTPDQRAAIKGKLGKAQAALGDQGFTQDKFGQTIQETAKGVKQARQISEFANAAAGSFHEMADALREVAPDTADTLETLGDIAGVAANAAGAVASFASGDIVGGIQGAIGAVAGVFSIGAKARASELKALEEIKTYKAGLLQGEINLNVEMRDRARTQQDINDLTNFELEARKKMLATQADQSKSDYDKLLAQVQSGQQITNIRTEKYGGFLGVGKKTRTVYDYGDLKGQTYEQLEALSIAGKLDEATEKLFQNLKNSHDEMEAIGDAAEDTAEIITNKLTGGLTADSISSAIINGVKNGKRAFADFADDAEEMVANAMLSALSYQLLSEPLKKIVEQFGKDAQDGLDSSEINNFKDGLNTTTDTFLKAADAVEKATGISLSGKTNTNDSGAAGVVRAALTEETGSAVVGRLNGVYDNGKQLVTLQKSSHQVFVDQLRGIQAIEINTFNTVVELEKVVVELKEIKANTKGSFGAKF